MIPVYFVACTDITCPLNQDRQCRAPFISIDSDGKCMIREGGPFHGKSPTEKHVEIIECQCQKCHHWELDEATNIGACGLRADLFFRQEIGKDSVLGPPSCNEYSKQVNPPDSRAV